MSAIAGEYIETPGVDPGALTKRRLKWLATTALGGLIALGAARYGYDWWTVGRFIESTDDAYVGGNVTAISPQVAGFIAQIWRRITSMSTRDSCSSVSTTAISGRGRPRRRQSPLPPGDPRRRATRELLAGTTIRQAEADLDSKTAQATFAKQDDQRYRELALTSCGFAAKRGKGVRADEALGGSLIQAGLEAAKQQLTASDAQITEARADVAQARPISDRPAQSRLHGIPLADRWLYRQSRRRGRRLRPSAPISLRSSRRTSLGGREFQGGPTRHGCRPSCDNRRRRLPGPTFHGHVVSLAPATGAVFSVIPPENATGNFTKIVQRVPVRIVLDDDASSRGIRPGLSTASVDTHRLRERAMTPPSSQLGAGPLPFVVMCVGMFIALLDIQIVASSLQDIGGGCPPPRIRSAGYRPPI